MFKSIGANWLLTVLNILSAYILMPFTVSKLGKENYGIWLLLTSLAGYLSLLLIGTPMAAVKFISTALRSPDDKELLESTLSIFSRINKILFVAALVAGAMLYFAFDYLFSIPRELESETKFSLLIVFLSTAGGFLLQLPYSVMAAHGHFVRRNKILALITVLKFASTLFFLTANPKISVLALIQASAFMLECLICWGTFRRLYTEAAMHRGKFQVEIFKKILSFSLYVMVLNIGIQLSYQTDALVIGAMLTVAAVAPYSIANSLTLYFMEFVVAIAAVILPEAARLSGPSNNLELQALFFKWSKIATAICFPAFIFCFFFGEAFLAWWVGEDLARDGAPVLITLMMSFLIFLPLRGVAQPVLMGRGVVKHPTIGFLLAGLGNLVLSVALAKYYGLLGVAIGTAIPNLMFAIYLLVLCSNELNSKVGSYFFNVFLKPFLVSTPIFIFIYLLGADFIQPKFWNLFFGGIGITGAFAALGWLTVYRNDPQLRIRLIR